jgi:hypothetical protein
VPIIHGSRVGVSISFDSKRFSNTVELGFRDSVDGDEVTAPVADNRCTTKRASAAPGFRPKLAPGGDQRVSPGTGINT